MSQSQDGTRTLALVGWDEQRFERGEYGPDDRAGVDAAFDRGSMSVDVCPVRYECRDGHETFQGITRDLDRTREPVAMLPDVPRTTAFLTRAEYRPYTAVETAVVCVARDADDALATAVWLANGSETDRDLQQNVRLHRGGGVGPSIAAVSDDDVLGALFADEPDRCILTGRPTTSHLLEVPYRYFPILDGSKRTERGVPRVPSTVGSLVGVVSHTAWKDHGLEPVDVRAPLDRVEAGTWVLEDDVVRVLEGADASNFTLERLGESRT